MLQPPLYANLHAQTQIRYDPSRRPEGGIPLQYQPLGKTGISVSRLCCGTLTVGPLQAALPPEEGAAVLAHAAGRGVNFFDTAQLYGTYPYLRRAMRLSGKYDVVIASKTYAHTRELAAEAVEQARRELDRDYIDIFLLHEQESIHTLRGHREALDYLWECKQRGIVRAVGASMHHVAAVYGAIETGLDVIHPLLNLEGLGIVDGTRADMEAAAAAAYNAGIGVYGMKPLGGGNLFRQATECLAYILGLPTLHSVAIGMQSADEVDADVQFWENGAFSEKAAEALGAKRRRLHIDDWCEGCGECARRCPQNALSIGEDGKARCRHERCVLCSYCAAACPAWAIKVV